MPWASRAPCYCSATWRPVALGQEWSGQRLVHRPHLRRRHDGGSRLPQMKALGPRALGYGRGAVECWRVFDGTSTGRGDHPGPRDPGGRRHDRLTALGYFDQRVWAATRGCGLHAHAEILRGPALGPDLGDHLTPTALTRGLIEAPGAGLIRNMDGATCLTAPGRTGGTYASRRADRAFVRPTVTFGSRTQAVRPSRSAPFGGTCRPRRRYSTFGPHRADGRVVGMGRRSPYCYVGLRARSMTSSRSTSTVSTLIWSDGSGCGPGCARPDEAFPLI